MIQKNINLIKAGVINERHSSAQEDKLKLDNPSPSNRVITEREFLGALVKNDSAKDLPKLKALAFGNILNSQNYAKQFASREC